MTKTTKQQRVSIFRKWSIDDHTIGCDGAVALPWCRMWLCIERDGYTHS